MYLIKYFFDVSLIDRGFINVDILMRTNGLHIFAIGDIVGQLMLAHKAVHEAYVSVEVISLAALAACNASCATCCPMPCVTPRQGATSSWPAACARGNFGCCAGTPAPACSPNKLGNALKRSPVLMPSKRCPRAWVWACSAFGSWPAHWVCPLGCKAVQAVAPALELR
jgi:hypothetical protein